MPNHPRKQTEKAILQKRTGRLFTTINRQAFYRSTGKNSAMKGTWFPFFGVTHKSNPYGLKKFKHHKQGWLVKAYKYAKRKNELDDLTLYRHAEFNSQFKTTFNNRGKQITSVNFYHRMTFLRCLVISARLGGGIWDSAFGLTLFNRLVDEMPEMNFSSINVVESGVIGRHDNPDKEYGHINQIVKSGLR